MEENKIKYPSFKKENELLRKQLAQREAELTIVNSVGEAMSKQLDVLTVTKIVGDKVREIFHTEVTEILLLNKATKMIEVPYSFYNGYRNYDPFPLGTGLTSKIIESRKPLLFGTIEDQAKNGGLFITEEDNTESYIGVPIIFAEEVLGVVSVQSYQKNIYDENNVRLLSTLSTSMGVALQNAKLFEESKKLLKETEQRSAELAIINSVGEAMSKQLDMNTVTRIVGDKVKEIFHSEVTEILLLDENEKMIHVPYSFYNGYQTVEPFELGAGLTTKVINSRKPLMLLSYSDQTKEGAITDVSIGNADETESYLGVPILFNNRILGVVSIQSYQKNAYDENDVRLLTTLSTNMGVTLENAKLFEETKRLLSETEQRTAELAIINSVQEGLATKLEMQAIYDLVGDKIRDIFDAQVVDIGLFNRDNNILNFPYTIERGIRFPDEPMQLIGFRKYVIETKLPLLIENNNEEVSRKYGNPLAIQGEAAKSILYVPMLVNGEARGVISLQNLDHENAFSESDVSLLTTLANAMSVALENARLFDETNRLLKETEQRTAELAVINSVQEGLAKELDIHGIYELVGEKIRKIFSAQVIDIVTYDRATNTIQDKYSYEKGDRTLLGLREPNGFRKQLIETKRLFLVNEDFSKLAKKYKNPTQIGEEPKSAVFVPMLVGEEVKGIISLQNLDTENAFSKSDVRLLTTLSNSMSVALENARLFDETNRLLKETEQRTAELAVINSVQEGLAKELDIKGVYELVGEKIREIFNAQVIDIVTYNKSTNMVEDKYAFEKGDRTLLGPREPHGFRKHLIETGQLILINKDYERTSIEYNNPVLIGEKPKSAVFVPMLVGDEVKGSISLQNLDSENAFSDSDVRLLTTLSNSMSVALENARLFDETNKLLEETKQQAIELGIINSVGDGLAKQLDFQSIVDLVGDKIREVFNAQVVSISTYNSQSATIHHRYAVEKKKRYYFDKSISIDPDRKEIIETKKPLIFGSSKEMIEHSGEGTVAGDMPESFMGVPIIHNQKVTGVITVQDLDRTNLYSKKDVQLLLTLASNMGVALENARLFEETKRLLNETQQRNVELSILNTIQEGLVMEMEFESIIKLVGDKFREALDFQDLGIRLYDKEKNILHFPYEYEHGNRLVINSMEPTPLSRYVLDSGKTLLLKKNTVEEKEKLGIFGTTTIPGTDVSKSLIMVPILLGSEAKGLILIENYEKEDAFTESDIRLLTTVANSMSVALENARLFNETLRLLDESKKRTAELGTVNSISQAIVGHLEINNLIKLVGDKVRDLFNANIVYLALLNKEQNMIQFPYGYGDDYPPLEFGEGLTSSIIINKKPLLINNEVDKKTEELGVKRIGTASASYLGVPIPVGDEIIGVLSVQSTENENVFGDGDMRLLSTIAAHVGIAINNANQYEELNKTLEDLRATQNQLVAQEKLASLGQLTAGIAHEIKNPLNFVNNFSELSVGLVEELREELDKLSAKIDKENLEEINDLLDAIKQNAEKTKEHGKRADSIVHSMLQHSRGKTGEKQLTDINSMLDEDLNLVYHGMRAQDGTFNIKIEREYDKRLSKVDVIPQDMSRVFLNILTNGCYEAHRKKFELNVDEPARILVKTTETDSHVEIRIRDNGHGIPEKIRGSLFTPFFTTKPTGKGTGLGLSISYDIVAAEHKGELLFETEEGKFTEFIIRLPKNQKK